ncbi:MAG: inositol monophosphatase family protein [Actinomycetota bacterium]
MDDKLIIELSNKIREKVLPYFGRPESKRISGKSIGGDSTFFIDDISEHFLSDYLKNEASNIAYYSEDRGLVKVGNPDHLLIIDPIDGTRAAACGFESSCISIAVSPFSTEAKLDDIEIAVVQEIKTGIIYFARKTEGTKIIEGNKSYNAVPSDNEEIDSLFWSIGLRGRPIVPLIAVLEELIDVSNFNGTLFGLGSASFSITRVAGGQLDCYIDIGHRLVTDFPVLEKNYLKVGQGSIINNYPYDIAAGYLILKEAGGIVTDACGKDMGNRPLMGIGKQYQLSTVASSNPSLHKILIMLIDRGFGRLEDNMKS